MKKTATKPRVRALKDRASELTESPKTMFSLIGEYSRLKNFLRTRTMVRAGEPVWDWSAEKVRRQGLMGPWTLNVYESTLAGAPGAILVWIADVLFPATQSASIDEDARLAEKFFGLAQPFLVPFSLMLLSWLAAWASLKMVHYTAQARRRAKSAYLYLDGSYGLAVQMCTATGITLLIDIGQRDGADSAAVLIAGLLLLAIGVPGGIYITFRRIPSKLFPVNGYSGETPRFWALRQRSDLGLGPWHKYTLTMWLLGGAGVYVLTFCLLVFSLLLGALLAPLSSR